MIITSFRNKPRITYSIEKPDYSLYSLPLYNLSNSRTAKPTKRSRISTISARKQGQFDAKTITEIQISLLSDDGKKTTLSQFPLTASVVRRSGGLHSRNKRGKGG